jgi:hypothetical protein
MTTKAEYLQAIASLRRIAGRPWAPIVIRDEGVKAKQEKRRQRRPSTSTLIRQAVMAGLTVTAIRPDGTLVTVPNKDDYVEGDEWDGVRLQ